MTARTLRDSISPHELDNIKARSPVRLGEHHVCLSLQVRVEALEQIFEQQGDQGAGQL